MYKRSLQELFLRDMRNIKQSQDLKIFDDIGKTIKIVSLQKKTPITRGLYWFY